MKPVGKKVATRVADQGRKAPAKISKVALEREENSRLEELRRETENILRLKGEIAQKFWDIGKSLGRIAEKDLFKEDGYGSFEEYLRKEVKISSARAYRLIEMSNKFSRETAYKYGQDKIRGAIEYAKATPEADRPFDVTRYEIEVRGPAGKITVKPFSEASGREIERAAARLRRRKERDLTRAPEPSSLFPAKEPRARLDMLQSRADDFLGTMSPRPRLELSVAGQGSDPVISLKLSNLPLSRLTEVLVYLAGAAV